MGRGEWCAWRGGCGDWVDGCVADGEWMGWDAWGAWEMIGWVGEGGWIFRVCIA